MFCEIDFFIFTDVNVIESSRSVQSFGHAVGRDVSLAAFCQLKYRIGVIFHS